MISASYDKKIIIWDYINGDFVRILYGHKDWVHSICKGYRSNILLSCSWDKTFRVWDIHKRNPLLRVWHEKYYARITSIILLNGSSVALGYNNGVIKLRSIWNFKMIKLLKISNMKTLKDVSCSCNDLAKIPNTDLLASSYSRFIGIWNIKDERLVKVLFCEDSSQINSILYIGRSTYRSNSSYNIISSCLNNRTVQFWNIDDGELITSIVGDHYGYVKSMAVTRTGDFFTVGDDRNIHFYIHFFHKSSFFKSLRNIFYSKKLVDVRIVCD